MVAPMSCPAFDAFAAVRRAKQAVTAPSVTLSGQRIPQRSNGTVLDLASRLRAGSPTHALVGGWASARLSARRICKGHVPRATHSWAISLGGGEGLPSSCVSAFLRALHSSNAMGIILAWGLPHEAAGQGKTVGRNCTCAPSARDSKHITGYLTLLNYKRLDVLGGAHDAALQVWRKTRPDGAPFQGSGWREQHLTDASNASTARRERWGCSRGDDKGAFRVPGDSKTWPLRDHYLDLGLAGCVAKLAHNATVIDVGGGSGQYGAYFHMQHQPLETPTLRFTMGPYRDVQVPPGGGTQPAPRAWTTVDGVANIEEVTRGIGPPGALVRYAHMCNASAERLPIHDWVISFEVGEHLPSACLANYLTSLEGASTHGIVITWSQTTTGTCHINPRRPHMVAAAFPMLGYEIDRAASNECTHGSTLMWNQKKGHVIVLRRKPEPCASNLRNHVHRYV